ncbi:MAG TPA: asparagine synthase (glutamine-hydrolyzing) [Gallionellaceae bacterium]
MCGILGSIGNGWVRREDFIGALDTLAHRGPDDRGVHESDGVWLGHRRLSIIDLSSGGHQPMTEQDSGATIVFNGEIFNYLELRAQLEREGCVFRAHSDTEVLLQAYLRWGPAALAKLNGMWAFAIWLPTQGKLFMARDRFGVKPLYYSRTQGGLSFASEPKALTRLFPVLRKPNHAAVYDFLAKGLLYANGQSFYQDVEVFPSAHYAEYYPQTGRFEFTRYWDYPDAGGAARSPQRDAVNEFTALFEDAVRLRMRSDVPVGVTLSGGLDSSAVLAAAMKGAPGERVCFTSVYGENARGESAWAKIAAEPYGIQPVEVAATKEGWLDTMRHIAYHMDAPGYSPAVYPLWHLVREARRRGVLVLLEGQGADEALGGYPQYAIISFMGQLRKLNGMSALRDARNTWKNLSATFTARWALLWLMRESFPGLIAYHRRNAGAYMTLSQGFRAAMETPSMQPPAGVVQPANATYSPVSQRLLLDHARNILPGLLHYGDAISMAHGVESRLPFMDYRLVEWLFANADDVKIKDGHTKWVLRRYLQNVGQGRIASRRDKQGYPTPIETWLAENNGAAVRDLLLVPDARIREFCDPHSVEVLLQRQLAGRAGAGNNMYRLVSMELWLRTCVDA